MDRAEAEAIYDAGREVCVEFILELAARVEAHEERLARLARISKQRIGTWFDVAGLGGRVVRRTGGGGAGRPTMGSRSVGVGRCA